MLFEYWHQDLSEDQALRQEDRWIHSWHQQQIYPFAAMLVLEVERAFEQAFERI